MKRMAFVLILSLLVLSSCKQLREDDGFVIDGCGISPSEYISSDLIVKAYGIVDVNGVKCQGSEGAYSNTKDMIVQISLKPSRNRWNMSEEEIRQMDVFIEYMKETCNRLLQERRMSCTYSTSFVSSTVSITSDVSLFGENPGEDISQHFKMLGGDVLADNDGAYMLKSDDYITVYASSMPGNRPSELVDFFFEGLVLVPGTIHGCYPICFKDTPTVTQKKVTLTVSIPVREKLMLSACHLDGSFHPEEIEWRERILSGSTTLFLD